MGALGSSKQSQHDRDDWTIALARCERHTLLLLLGAGLGGTLGSLLLRHGEGGCCF